MRRLALAACAALALAAPAGAKKKYGLAPPTEGGLIDDVNGYTVAKDGSLTRFTGLLIGKDGKVARLLKAGEERPKWLDYRQDAHGRTMLPGLIDAHGHIMDYGFQLTTLDLSATTSLADMQTKLANYAAHKQTPGWIRGFGWNQERWPDKRFPTAQDLDLAARERPVLLERVDGHAVVVNSAAMAAAGIGPSTKDVPGGRIERDAKGRPTGLFVDAAVALVKRAMPQAAAIEVDDAFGHAQEKLLSYGVTAVADMKTELSDWNAWRRAGDRGALRIRIASYADGIDVAASVAGEGPTPWLYDGRLRMVGVKLFADGALGSRGAWLKRPYADMPSTRGLQFMDDAQVRNRMSRAAMDGFQVAIHAIGDAANAQALDSIEELAQTYKGDRRWRIEHAQIVDPADLPRFARNGIVASMQPTHETGDWAMAEARLGPERLAGAYAWKTMLDEHVPLAFGSDFPVESPNPFPGLAAAVSRQDAAGRPAGGWHPEQRIGIAQALAAFTTGAAYAEGAEDRIGSLQPGHYADFVLINGDPIANPDPQTLRAIRVAETWIGGVRVWELK
ncbi:amidohydrolase [Sphingomonas sp.]|uniref:amidohydrolase n=1 Tax=Sphingomonas sp. TaxID=28214 RepID=UPI003AFF782D